MAKAIRQLLHKSSLVLRACGKLSQIKRINNVCHLGKIAKNGVIVGLKSGGQVLDGSKGRH